MVINDIKDASVCKGQIFRANVSNCNTTRGVMFSVRLEHLKRKSCPGCEKCEWVWDSLSEVSNDWAIIGIGECKHGKLYTLTITNEARDPETGVVDEWDLKVVEVPDKIFTGYTDVDGTHIHEGHVVYIEGKPFEVMLNRMSRKWVVDGDTGQTDLHKIHHMCKVRK